MDINAIWKATTKDEKQKYQTEGHCYNCSKQGHLSHNCPDHKPQIATTTNDSTFWITVASATSTPDNKTFDDAYIRKMARDAQKLNAAQQNLLAEEMKKLGADFQ